MVPLGALLQSIRVMQRGEAKVPVPLGRGHGDELQPKKGPILGWKGSSKTQVHPPVLRSRFLFTPRLCHLRLRHHIPFRGKGQILPFLGRERSRLRVEGRGGSRRFPSGEQALPTPTSRRGFGKRLETTRRRLEITQIQGPAKWKLLHCSTVAVWGRLRSRHPRASVSPSELTRFRRALPGPSFSRCFAKRF